MITNKYPLKTRREIIMMNGGIRRRHNGRGKSDSSVLRSKIDSKSLVWIIYNDINNINVSKHEAGNI